MTRAARVTASILFLGVLLTATPAQATVIPIQIRDNPTSSEYAPAATANWVAWSDATVGRVYGENRTTGPSLFRLNPGRTFAFNTTPVTGGASSELVMYQEVSSNGIKSDLVFFDMATQVRTKPPAKVDTQDWEFAGVASTRYIFFNRLSGKWNYMLLFNRRNNHLTTIARFTAKCPRCYRPTWVGTHHAVYDRCSARTGACDPRVLTIGGSTVAVPVAPAPVSQYGGSLDEASGDLYFIRSSLYCGLFVSIERANIASPGTQTDLYDTAAGTDLESTSLAPDIATPGDIDLLFAEYDCMGLDSGVYELNNVNAL